MSSSARQVARDVLARVEAGEFASLALDAELGSSGLDSRDRSLATELTYGVLRYRSRLDRALAKVSRSGLSRVKKDVRIALRVAAYQLLFLDRVPDHAAVNDAVSAVSRRGKSVRGFVNGLLRSLVRDGEAPLPAPGPDSAAEHFAMPQPLMSDLVAALPQDSDVFEATRALNSRPPLWLRPNPERASADQVGAELEGSTLHPTGAVRIEAGGSPDRLPGWSQGRFTVQDLAAQWVGLVAAPPRGGRVLDACAGVGGKTTHLAELVGPDGKVDAVDQSADKLAKLRAAATRLGLAERIRVITADLEAEVSELASDYQVVVIDAPCTGIGVMRRHPEIKWRDSRVNLDQLLVTQRKLLASLAPRVAVGGALVYAVCSFRAEEGAQQVEAFLADHPEFELDVEAPPGVPLGRHHAGYLQTWPHLDDADAFFAARLIRRS
jgi:16S rRNA (cytosine967-C5)-methyltransferase